MKISFSHTHIPSKILISLQRFPPLFLWRYITEDSSVSFFSGSSMMGSRCLHHTFQQWALVPPLIQVGYCLQMRGNGGAHAASCQDQVLPVLRSGQTSVWLIEPWPSDSLTPLRWEPQHRCNACSSHNMLYTAGQASAFYSGVYCMMTQQCNCPLCIMPLN